MCASTFSTLALRPDLCKKSGMSVGDSSGSALDFESALAQLQGIVQKLESGDLSLEDSLKGFEEGVRLTRQCQEVLQHAEQRVQILTQNGN